MNRKTIAIELDLPLNEAKQLKARFDSGELVTIAGLKVFAVELEPDEPEPDEPEPDEPEPDEPEPDEPEPDEPEPDEPEPDEPDEPGQII
jgi:hypothetical protein